MEKVETNNQNDATAQSKSARLFRRRLLIAGLIVVIAVAIGSFFFANRPPSIPKTVVDAVSFPVFYPSPLPDGYKLQKNSVKVQSKIVFFILVNGDNKINVSEQSLPGVTPDLDSLTQAGFSKINTPLGKAVQGTNKSQAVAILLTNTTLVNVSGGSNTPSDAVTSIITRLHSIPR